MIVASSSGPPFTTEIYVTPAQLCELWDIDDRTLGKFDLPWIWFGPLTRRIEWSIAKAYAEKQRFHTNLKPRKTGH